MPVPGVDVNVILSSVVSSQDIPTTARYLIVGLADRGPTTRAVAVNSLAAFEAAYGYRTTYGQLWDAARIYFAEAGGGEVDVVRVVGPAATLATISIATAVRFDAASQGSWATGLQVVIAAGSVSGFKVSVLSSTATGSQLLESYDNLADTDAVVASVWSNIVPVKLGATVLTNQTVTLAGGADDRASVTGTILGTALALFTDVFVGGVVDIPGYACTTVAGTGTIGSALNAHAQAFDRIAYLGLAAAATQLDSTNASTAMKTAFGAQGQYSGLFHPWVTVTNGVLRYNVPATAFEAGRRAKAHMRYGPNTAVAGQVGKAEFAVDVETRYDAAAGTVMNAVAVNAIRIIDGAPTTYGYRSLQTSDARWQMLNVRDLTNTIVAGAKTIGRKYVFRTIDGRGQLLSQFKNELRGLMDAYLAAGQIFAVAPDFGYIVDVGPAINTATTLANNQLRARLGFRPSPTAEYVLIDVSIALVNGPL